MEGWMKMLYRPHRETLDDSMKEVVEVNDLVQLEKLMPINGVITFSHVGYDDRVGWDTYYVCVDGKVVGMSNGAWEAIGDG